MRYFAAPRITHIVLAKDGFFLQLAKAAILGVSSAVLFKCFHYT